MLQRRNALEQLVVRLRTTALSAPSSMRRWVRHALNAKADTIGARVSSIALGLPSTTLVAAKQGALRAHSGTSHQGKGCRVASYQTFNLDGLGRLEHLLYEVHSRDLVGNHQTEGWV